MSRHQKKRSVVYSEYEFSSKRSKCYTPEVDWKEIDKQLNKILSKATSIQLGVAYSVETDFNEQFEGVLVYQRGLILGFDDYDGKYHSATAGKCKLKRLNNETEL